MMEVLTGLLSGTKLEWMVASMFIAVLSTIVYNSVKDRLMGDNSPKEWGWATFPFWFVSWLYQDTAFYAILLALIWLSYKRRGKKS